MGQSKEETLTLGKSEQGKPHQRQIRKKGNHYLIKQKSQEKPGGGGTKGRVHGVSGNGGMEGLIKRDQFKKGKKKGNEDGGATGTGQGLSQSTKEGMTSQALRVDQPNHGQKGNSRTDAGRVPCYISREKKKGGRTFCTLKKRESPKFKEEIER